jgi:hypothetical protein
MTNKLYLDDQYLRRFSSTVIQTIDGEYIFSNILVFRADKLGGQIIIEVDCGFKQ